MRIITTFLCLFLIFEIEASSDLSCEVEVRADPFDRGFQKERTFSVICQFDDNIEIDTPTILSNSLNENVTHLLFRPNKKIQFLPQNVSVSFPNLRLIDAHGCLVKSLNKNNFQGLTKLVKIELENNDLETIDENSFDDLVNLVYLYINDNKIANLPSKVFEKLENLDTVYLRNNELTSLDAEIFKNNKKIALLHISDNKLKTLPQGIFDGLTLVRQLWLKSNEIENLPPHIFDDCESLIDLDLSRNKIKTINSNWLTKLNSLHEVSFSFNPLDFIDLTIFDNNKDLSDFYFNGVATKDIRNIEKVDQMKRIKGIGFHNTCVDGQFHEGNLDKLKEAVKANCKVIDN